MLEPEITAGIAEGFGAIARAVVGHHPRNGDAQADVVGDGGPEEGDGALLFLVGQNLGGADPACIVDRDVDELPTDGSSAAMRLRPRRLRTRLTVAGDTLSSAAIRLPVKRCRRSASIRSTTAIGVGRCKRCGREERSCNPAMPSASKRATHLRAVRGQTPAARAAASGVCPLRTARARRSRPQGVKRAFLWTLIRSSSETEALTGVIPIAAANEFVFPKFRRRGLEWQKGEEYGCGPH